jgi:hypothetical protein
LKIECSLREISKSSLYQSEIKKNGRYMSSVYPVPGFGVEKWVVGCYMDIDYDKYLKEITEEELVSACLEHLNTPPPRKRFERKVDKPLYGKLELFSYKLRKSQERNFIELQLITDERQNKHFWGEGVKLDVQRKRRSRKTSQVLI